MFGEPPTDDDGDDVPSDDGGGGVVRPCFSSYLAASRFREALASLIALILVFHSLSEGVLSAAAPL